MIFVSVGTQFPFDRLIRTVDEWALRSGTRDIVAQIGHSTYRPQNMETHESIAPAQFAAYQRQADLLISHAGMGAILTAQELGKPLIILPRRGGLSEHRNDHQMDTVRQFRGKMGIYVAEDEADLARLLDRSEELRGCGQISPHASPELIGKLRSFFSGHIASSRKADINGQPVTLPRHSENS